MSNSSARPALSIGRSEQFYPNPFFDISSTYLPTNIRDLFEYCLRYQLTNPIINAVTTKLAAYSITDVVYPTGSSAAGDAALYDNIFNNQLSLRRTLIEHNLDYFTFGNAFCSVLTPIDKYLRCPRCKAEKKAAVTTYVWRDFAFNGKCSKCSEVVDFVPEDRIVRSSPRIRLIRWNPQNITIRHNPLTSSSQYFYNPPKSVRNAIIMGDRSYIEELPNEVLIAIKNQRVVAFADGAIFHSKRPTVSRDVMDAGWGAPLILPILKDAFLLQVLKKAHEAVAMEHVVPMRVLFPQAGSQDSSPYSNVNIKDWQAQVQGHIQQWRRDINHIPIMPLPMGYQTIGGQGKTLMLHNEIRMLSEMMIAGMGIPVSMFYGDAAYSGASVNMKSLENEFSGLRQDNHKLVIYLHEKVASILNRPTMIPRFKPFKMADDLQRAAFEAQLFDKDIISGQTFMQNMTLDYNKEQETVLKELDTREKIMVRRSEIQGTAQARGMAKMPQQPQQAGQPGQPQPGQPTGQPQEGMASPQMSQPAAQAADPAAEEAGKVDQITEFLSSVEDPTRRNKTLNLIKERDPTLYGKVMQRMTEQGVE